jgi:hypothetical protein
MEEAQNKCQSARHPLTSRTLLILFGCVERAPPPAAFDFARNSIRNTSNRIPGPNDYRNFYTRRRVPGRFVPDSIATP